MKRVLFWGLVTTVISLFILYPAVGIYSAAKNVSTSQTTTPASKPNEQQTPQYNIPTDTDTVVIPTKK